MTAKHSLQERQKNGKMLESRKRHAKGHLRLYACFPGEAVHQSQLEIRSFSWATFPLVRLITYRDDYRTI